MERQPLGVVEASNTPTTLAQPTVRAVSALAGSPLVASPVLPRKEFMMAPSSLGPSPLCAPAQPSYYEEAPAAEATDEEAPPVGGVFSTSAPLSAVANEDPLFWTAVEALLGGRSERRWRPPTPPIEEEEAAEPPAAHHAQYHQPAQHVPQFPPPPLHNVPHYAPPVPMPAYEPAHPTEGPGGAAGGPNKRLRSARCGVCPGCNSGDCGECKNCLDKPRFGGPGCRKQACLQRTCSMPKLVDEREEGGLPPANGSGVESDGGASDQTSSAEMTPPLAPDAAGSPHWVPDLEQLPERAPMAERGAVLAQPAPGAKPALQWHSMLAPSLRIETAPPPARVLEETCGADDSAAETIFALGQQKPFNRTYSEEGCA